MLWLLFYAGRISFALTHCLLHSHVMYTFSVHCSPLSCIPQSSPPLSPLLSLLSSPLSSLLLSSSHSTSLPPFPILLPSLNLYSFLFFLPPSSPFSPISVPTLTPPLHALFTRNEYMLMTQQYQMSLVQLQVPGTASAVAQDPAGGGGSGEGDAKTVSLSDTSGGGMLCVYMFVCELVGVYVRGLVATCAMSVWGM